MISIIVPTVAGREDYLQECLASYAAHTADYELHLLVDRPTCGTAWVEGAKWAKGDYIHFSADDLQPLHGWEVAARRFVDAGVLPAPRILHSDGTIQSCGGTDQWNHPHENPEGFQVDFPRIPFLTRAQWDKIRPLAESFLDQAHYYTDNAIGVAAQYVGIRTAVSRGYAFYHHVAKEKRGAGMAETDRMRHDYELFKDWANDLVGVPA